MFWKKKEEYQKEEAGKKVNFDELWIRGFEHGFRSAWTWMTPYMQEAKEEVRKTAYNLAMEQALRDLEPTMKRIEELGYKIR